MKNQRMTDLDPLQPLELADAEATVLDLLAMHAESAGDSIVDDLCTLEIIFSL